MGLFMEFSRGSGSTILTSVRIFVHEHVTGGGLAGEPLPSSLAREGLAMLYAVSEDIAALPDVSAVITLDERVGLPRLPAGLEVARVSGRTAAMARFRGLSGECDGTLVIAPESRGVLAAAVRAVTAAGGRHLGSSAEAIERASDKLLLPSLLRSAGVPSVPAEPWDGRRAAFPLPAVVKPRRGAGSVGVVLLDGSRPAPEEPDGDELIITPYIQGLAASVLAIVGPRGAVALRASTQDLSPGGDFAYLGGRLPLPGALERRARVLALRAVRAIGGLAGFVGVDLVLDPDPAGASSPRDVVVEVNARLTTSYVGLRAHARTNLASVWLAAVTGRPLPRIAWRRGETRFLADGTITHRAEARRATARALDP